jgi:hypothetical protein
MYAALGACRHFVDGDCVKPRPSFAATILIAYLELRRPAEVRYLASPFLSELKQPRAEVALTCAADFF